MGFPTPFSACSKNELREFITDTLSNQRALQRDQINNQQVFNNLSKDEGFGIWLWGFLSLELWQQEFHDKAHEYRKRIAV
jgi:asparagine synthase (glutamine-hydrolysing)